MIRTGIASIALVLTTIACSGAAAPGAGSPAPGSGLPSAIPHPVAGREACTSCHTVGGPGAGQPGGLGMPANHQGRTDAVCQGCHKPQA